MHICISIPASLLLQRLFYLFKLDGNAEELKHAWPIDLKDTSRLSLLPAMPVAQKAL